MQARDEQVLINKAVRGDSEAFADLYRRHVARVRATVAWKLRSREDIEDLVQMTFFRAFKGLKTFRGSAAFSTWLTRIALNECLSYLRKQCRCDAYLGCESVVADIVEHMGPSPGADPETQFCITEVQTQVRQGIWALPGVYREVVWLHYIEHVSLRDLAHRFSVAEGTVKTWLYRGRKKLGYMLRSEHAS